MRKNTTLEPEAVNSILIVEDEAIIAASLKVLLVKLGYTVTGITDNGADAVDMARRLRPDLVMMDIQLRGDQDGIQAAGTIRDSLDIPVIYLTAHSDPATFSRAKLSGPAGYILKPFEGRDLTAQIELALYKHRADRKLRESEARYRSLFQDNHAVLLLVDPHDGRIIDANQAACDYYGYSREAITALKIDDVNTMTADGLIREMYAAVSKGQRHFYSKHRLAGGDVRDVEVFSGPIVIEGEELLYVIVHDITERRQAEAALHRLNETLESKVAERTRLAEKRAAYIQTLAVELIQTEERERKRIAQLLHDDLQQILAAAKLQLEVACENLPVVQELVKVDSWLAGSIKKIRSLSYELSPAVFQHGDLDTSFRLIARQMKERFRLDVQVDIQTHRTLDDELLRVFVYRALRELLFNVVKHADVKSARVSVAASGDDLVIMVSDRGCGFDPVILQRDARSAGIGIGLPELQKRAADIGGSLEIDSTPDNGSRFTLTIPFRLEHAAEDGFASPFAV